MRLNKNTPLVLMILDGFGYDEQIEHNAIARAHTPHWDEWWKTCPHILLEASGEHVGLPHGQMGNSEVGHMHIGAGRAIFQDFTRINQAITKGELVTNKVLCATIEDLKESGHTLHLMGLLSPGGVHSHEDHLLAILETCRHHQFKAISLHLFLDGRDTPPQSAESSLNRLIAYLDTNPIATIASITGRYYAMDRDKRWERIEATYRCLTEQTFSNPLFTDPRVALEAYYQQHLTDEFIPPTQIGTHPHLIQDGDGIFFFNFRADRARQLTAAFIQPDFADFKRHIQPQISHFLSMSHYANYLATECVFSQEPLKDTLGEVIAKSNLSQLRIAETEKYPHVTFFFNGGRETPFAKEKRIMIPSPAVATYDLQPEMSAPELTEVMVDAIKNQAYDVIICNYANADMVGHSGNFQATVKAIECLDKAMEAIGQALNTYGGQMLITADHGNAEQMYDPITKQHHTAHTLRPVPLVFVGSSEWEFNVSHGSLIDIAPTLLTLLHLPIPETMSGRVIMVNKHEN